MAFSPMAGRDPMANRALMNIDDTVAAR